MAVSMIQLNSRQEWLEHRKKYIGGSDASCVLGLNQWKTNLELWEEKVGLKKSEDISDKPYVQYGISAEPLLRELFKLNYPQYEVFYEDNNSFLNDEVPYAAASLDGWLIEKETGRHGIWECKTSEIVSSVQKEKWAGRLPDNYYCQLLHYFLVRKDCEFAKVTGILKFKSDDGEVYQQVRNYHIERADVEADIQQLKNEELKFWKLVQERKLPNLILPEI